MATRSLSKREDDLPLGRTKVTFHVFDLLKVKGHVCSEDDVNDSTPELPETSVKHKHYTAYHQTL